MQRSRCARLLFLLAAITVASGPVRAQITTSYVDDSVLARESLVRMADLLSTGNLAEAARIIQAVLDTETDRVIESPTDPELFIGVRAAVHAELLSRPALLEHYRRAEEPVAESMLKEGRAAEVERSRLLTRSGFQAAMQLAQEHFEAARFEAARLTLEQLDRHPDRAEPALGAQAAELARSISRYLPRPAMVQLAQRWASESGLPAADSSPVPWPKAWDETLGRDPVTPGPASTLDSLVNGPLQSVFLSADAAVEFRANLEVPRDDGLPAWRIAWTFPAIVGDAVVVNDGRAVTAFDRFTLSPLWRKDFSQAALEEASEPGTEFPRGAIGVTRVEEANSVSAAEGVVVASMGILSQQAREGEDTRIHAIELATGRDLWALTPGAVADPLRLAEVRGPVTIDQSTAVITFRKDSAARRLISTYLAGVDLWTGRTRWVRLVGSAGSIGSFGTRPGETPVAHQGIVYRADDYGLVSAIESATGRIHWIRILKSEMQLRATESSPANATQAPIIDGDSMVVLAPSQKFIHRLSLESGAILGSREAAGGLPLPIHYLLSAGRGENRKLVTVSNNQMALLPLSGFEKGRAALIPALTDQSGFWGRVVVMGDTIAAPVAGGLMLANINSPGDPQFRALDFTGNLVASGSNLLIADSWRLHSFLSWDDADKLLSARIKADPGDPRPALALAELAYRSQHLDRLLPAADQALGALAAAPQSPVTLQVKSRLFLSLLEMVRSATTTPVRPQDHAHPPARINDLALVDALVGRLERVAETPTENLQWLISLGAVRELQSKAPEACEAYQRILEEPRLAETPWKELSPPVRGRQLAIDRLRRVIGAFGLPAYARFNSELQSEIAALPSAPDVRAIEALAARYPVGGDTPELWLRTAKVHRARGELAAAAHALAQGADVAGWLVSVGVGAEQARLGEVLGCQAETLAALGRPMTAAQLLMRAVKTQPGMPITCGGSSINPTARAAELRHSAITDARRARVGSEPAREVDVLPGWTLLSPALDRELSPIASHEWVVMLSPARRELAMFADPGDGTLSPIWARQFQGEPPTLLHSGPDAIFLLWRDDTAVERLDPATGEAVWRTAPLARVLPPAVASNIRSFDTPLDGPVHANDIIASIGERFVVLSQRDGSAAVFDVAGGQLAWAARTPLTRVYDMVLSGNRLVFAGATDPRDALEPDPGDRRDPRSTPRPVVIVLDPADGRAVYELPAVDSDVRWVRASAGILAVSQSDRIRGFDLATGKPAWADIIENDEHAPDGWVFHAAEGWAFDDRLYVLSGRRELHQVSLRTGEHHPVDTHAIDRLPDRGEIIAGRVGSNIAFSSRLGVLLLNPEGTLVGANTVPAHMAFRPAVAAQQFIALAEQSTDELPDGRSSIRIMLTSADSAKLVRTLAIVVHSDPDAVEIAFLDGKLLLSTDAVTQVISLPEPPAKPGAAP